MLKDDPTAYYDLISNGTCESKHMGKEARANHAMQSLGSYRKVLASSKIEGTGQEWEGCLSWLILFFVRTPWALGQHERLFSGPGNLLARMLGLKAGIHQKIGMDMGQGMGSKKGSDRGRYGL